MRSAGSRPAKRRMAEKWSVTVVAGHCVQYAVRVRHELSVATRTKKLTQGRVRGCPCTRPQWTILLEKKLVNLDHLEGTRLFMFHVHGKTKQAYISVFNMREVREGQFERTLSTARKLSHASLFDTRSQDGVTTPKIDGHSSLKLCRRYHDSKIWKPAFRRK